MLVKSASTSHIAVYSFHLPPLAEAKPHLHHSALATSKPPPPFHVELLSRNHRTLTAIKLSHTPLLRQHCHHSKPPSHTQRNSNLEATAVKPPHNPKPLHPHPSAIEEARLTKSARQHQEPPTESSMPETVVLSDASTPDSSNDSTLDLKPLGCTSLEGLEDLEPHASPTPSMITLP